LTIMTYAGKMSVLAVAAAAMLLIIGLSLPLTGWRLWSLDAWTYLPAITNFIVLGAVTLLTILIANVSRIFPSGLGRYPVVRPIGWLLASAGMAALFYWLSAETMLYGDGYVRSAEIVESGKWFRFTEPLDAFIKQSIYQVANRLWNWEIEQVFRLVSILSGIICFWITVAIGRLVSTKQRYQALTIALLWAGGLPALFFGYIEVYSTSVAALAGFIYVSLAALQQKRSAAVVIVVFVVTCLFHTSMLCLAPALAYVLKKSNHWRWTVAVAATSALVALLGLMIYLVSIVEHEGGYSVGFFEFVLIPLTPVAGYWLLSPHHLLDIVNQYIFVAPAGIASLLVLIPTLGTNLRRPPVIFLSVSSLLAFGFALLFNTHLGFARDWDLFAFIGLPVNLLAALLWSYSGRRPVAAWPLVWMGLLIAGAYVAMLANESAAVARFEDITENSRHGRAYNFETLSKYYIDKRQYRSAIAALQQADQTETNARYPHLIGSLHLALDQPRNAITALSRSLKIDSSYAKNFPLFVEAYTRLKMRDSAMTYLELAVNHLPQGASAADYYLVGIWKQEQGHQQEARQYLQQAIELAEKLAQSHPEGFRNYLTAARSGLAVGDTLLARRWLERLEHRQPPASIRLELLKLQQSLEYGEDGPH
jgi:tetratricopeptide (TPR) repeat protein